MSAPHLHPVGHGRTCPGDLGGDGVVDDGPVVPDVLSDIATVQCDVHADDPVDVRNRDVVIQHARQRSPGWHTWAGRLCRSERQRVGGGGWPLGEREENENERRALVDDPASKNGPSTLRTVTPTVESRHPQRTTLDARMLRRGGHARSSRPNGPHADPSRALLRAISAGWLRYPGRVPPSCRRVLPGAPAGVVMYRAGPA